MTLALQCLDVVIPAVLHVWRAQRDQLQLLRRFLLQFTEDRTREADGLGEERRTAVHTAIGGLYPVTVEAARFRLRQHHRPPGRGAQLLHGQLRVREHAIDPAEWIGRRCLVEH